MDNNKNLTIFNYNEEKKIRTFIIDNEPYFVLSDVCLILGLTNSRMVASRLDKSDVSSADIIDSMNRNQKITIINELGLYDVILKSDKEEAKKIKHWITHEVLPSLRKTGKYELQTQNNNEFIAEAVKSLKIINQQLSEISFTLTKHENITSNHESRLQKIETEIFHKKEYDKEYFTPTQLGNMFDIPKSGQYINKLLQQKGLQYKVSGEWVSTYQGRKYVHVQDVQLDNGKLKRQMIWHREVFELIKDL
jgi:anti-repressor protein